MGWWPKPCPSHIAKLKKNKINVLRFHILLYVFYLGNGVIEHIGWNLMCGLYGSLLGVTVVCHVVCEEI